MFGFIRKAVSLTIVLIPISCGAQDIEIRKQNVAIPHGSLASGLAGTFLPMSELSSPASGFVTIRNKSATTNLTLTGAQLSGSGANQFQITDSLPPSLGPNTDFSMSFAATPSSPGEKTAVITVSSNDPDTPAYQFEVRVIAVANGTLPPLPNLSFANVSPIGAVKEKSSGLLTFKFPVIIENNGDGDYEGGTVEMYYSQNELFDQSATLIATRTLKKIKAAKPGKPDRSKKLNLKCIVPSASGCVYTICTPHSASADKTPANNLIKVFVPQPI
jgi:hypothetical protein